jgi:hypothetical protein
MMIIVLLVGIIALLIALVMTSRSSVVPWLNQMTRLNPGVYNRGEWMAPGLIVETIQRDYLAFYRYAAETLPQGWMVYLRDLDRYLTGDMLRLQRESLDLRLRHDRGRIIAILRAHHHLQVRHFSNDGLRCLVIDHQSEQRMATYDYWTGKRLHTQDLGGMVYIYQMQFDQAAGRWKIDHLVQQMLPDVYPAHVMEINLPQTVGRDQ